MNYTCNYFSLSLPKGEGQGNLPQLLKHLSEALIELGEVTILDIKYSEDEDDDGNTFPLFTVYYIGK